MSQSLVPTTLSVRMVPLEQVQNDMKLMVRVSMVAEVADQYADQLQVDGMEFPPIDIAEIAEKGNALFITDGFLRFGAYRRLRASEVPCRIRSVQTWDEAVELACRSNSHEGLRRSTADKRKAMLMMMNTAQGVLMNDQQLASAVGVSREMVRQWREQTTPPSVQMQPLQAGGTPVNPNERRLSSNGREMPTSYKKKGTPSTTGAIRTTAQIMEEEGVTAGRAQTIQNEEILARGKPAPTTPPGTSLPGPVAAATMATPPTVRGPKEPKQLTPEEAQEHARQVFNMIRDIGRAAKPLYEALQNAPVEVAMRALDGMHDAKALRQRLDYYRTELTVVVDAISMALSLPPAEKAA